MGVVHLNETCSLGGLGYVGDWTSEARLIDGQWRVMDGGMGMGMGTGMHENQINPEHYLKMKMKSSGIIEDWKCRKGGSLGSH